MRTNILIQTRFGYVECSVLTCSLHSLDGSFGFGLFFFSLIHLRILFDICSYSENKIHCLLLSTVLILQFVQCSYVNKAMQLWRPAVTNVFGLGSDRFYFFLNFFGCLCLVLNQIKFKLLDLPGFLWNFFVHSHDAQYT